MEDHILALRDLESIVKIDPNNSQIRKNYEELSAFINSEKIGEKKVFKSFFRKINETGIYKDLTQTKNDNEKSSSDKTIYSQVNQDDISIGKPEIRILNL